MNEARQAGRRYMIRFGIAISSYVVLLLLALLIMSRLAPGSPWRWLVMALPIPALVMVVLAVGRFVVESDELQSRIQLQAMSIAFAAGSAITFGYGLMQTAGAPTLSWLWVWPVFAVCWVIAGFVVRHRY